MFEDNQKRQRIFRKLSFITVFLAFAWGLLGFYIFATASRFSDSANGKTHHIYYKSTEFYVSDIQYYVFIGLMIAAFLSIPFFTMITSPKGGLFNYDD